MTADRLFRNVSLMADPGCWHSSENWDIIVVRWCNSEAGVRMPTRNLVRREYTGFVQPARPAFTLGEVIDFFSVQFSRGLPSRD